MSDGITTDFPRGGAQSLTPLEARKVRNKAEKDVLFGNYEPETKKRRKSSTGKKGVKEPLETKLVTAKGLTIEHFSFKYLVKGLLVLGYVKEINKKNIIVGLPNGLNGYVAISDLQTYLSELNGSEEISEGEEDEVENDLKVTPLTLFKVGNLIPVALKELFPSKHGHQKICFSVLPVDINVSVARSCISENMLIWGAVQSEEDHGYIISIKGDSLTGFLPKSNAKGGISVGSLKWFHVKKMNANKKGFTLSMKKIKNVQVSEKTAHFNSFLPGQLVKLTVSEVSDEIVSGKVFQSFDAVVDRLHLSAEEEPENFMKKNTQVNGRIIHINPKTKQIGISCLEQVVSFPDNIISNNHDIGDILEDCEVTNADSSSGLIMKTKNGESGIVHISRVSDDHIEKLGKKYKEKTKHRCRVLGYSALDSKYTLTMRISDLEKQFLRYDDLKPGMVVSGTIITLEEFGCLVKITDHIRGLCPRMHLADINLKYPEKKFIEGKKLKCRVLTVKADARGLVLTHKKTLVNSDLSIVTSLEGAKVGNVTHGFVSDIKDFGLIIKFYNGVRALLPKHEIRSDAVHYVGQVLQCTISSIKLSTNRMTVSLKPPELLSLEPKKTVTTGKNVSGKFNNVTDDKVRIKLKDGSLGTLPIQHMSDFTSINEEWMQILKHAPKDFKLKELVVIGLDKKTNEPLLSQKDLHVKYSDRAVKMFEDLQVGSVYGGIISHVMPYGMFIELAQGVTGLVPNSNLSDDFIKDIAATYKIGQSVLVKVTDTDKEKRRFLATMKSSVLLEEMEEGSLNSTYSGVDCLQVYLNQRSKLFTLTKLSTDSCIRALPSLVGEVIPVKVKSVDRTNITVIYHDKANNIDVVGTIPQVLRYGADIEISDECQCCVLHVDMKTSTFTATTNNEMIEDVIKRRKKRTRIKFDSKSKIDVIVGHVTNDVVIVTMPKHGYTLGYMPVRRHLNDVCDATKKYLINQKLVVQYERKHNEEIIVRDLNDEDEKDIKVGSIVSAVIKGIKPTQLSVTLLNGRIHGRVHISQILDDVKEGESPLQEFKPSQTIRAKIIGFKDMKTHKYLPISHTNILKSLAELSLKPSILSCDDLPDSLNEKKVQDYEKGESINCFITAVNKSCAWVSVSPSITGRISMLCLLTHVKEQKKYHSSFKPGQAYPVVVIGHDDEKKHLDLSRIGDPEKLVIKKSIVTGRISKKMPHGLLIELPNRKCGIAHVTELFDSYQENPLNSFSVHQFVRCQVLSVEKENQIDLSLRESRVSSVDLQEDMDRAINGYDDIKEGDILRGYVKSCMKIGVFVSLSPSITGRVQIKNLSQYFVKEFMTLFPIGKLVKAKILSIDPSNNRIDLSLRGKDVGGPDPAPAPKRKLEDEIKDDSVATEDDTTKRIKLDVNSEEESDDSEDSEDENDVTKRVEDDEYTTDAPSLKLPSKFDWTAQDSDENVRQSENSGDSSDDESNPRALAKKTKRQKRAAKKAEEEYLHKAELTLLDTERQMESAEDFDRIILGSPNSSIIWIQYMAFHLHSAEVDKARMVAQRALKTISFREEQEKLNVWVAYLNLESLYGTKETLENSFHEAVKVNEPKKIYLKMVEIYIKNEKKEAAEKLYQTMLKKFKSSKSVWVGYATFMMKTQQVEEARKLLQRSLKSLPQRKHVETIVKFAMLEYKMGEPQRGSTIFESVLKNYPKRTDLWSVYVDMLIKQGDLEQVRNVFERATTLNMSSKKIKFLFKRYIEFEEQYGTKATVEGVRKKAMEYVENTMQEDE